MRWIPIGAIVVACAACQTPPDETQRAGLPGQPQPLQAAPHDVAAPVTAGKPEQAEGQACEQPDGSRRVVQNTPGLPAQSYAPGPPAAAASASASPPATPAFLQQL